MKELLEALHKRFIFGKLIEPLTSVTFVGRTLEIKPDYIGVHFEKYIREELRFIVVETLQLS